LTTSDSDYTANHGNFQPKSAALEAHEAGLCVVPPLQDGSKRPFGEWKRYQSQRPSIGQIKSWYAVNRTGIGIITGGISGNLEMVEFEDEEHYLAFKEAAVGLGLGALVKKIENGYLEKPPRGGRHWVYRCDEISGNTKLATDSNGSVLIETRGEGGYVVTAPSYGKVHPTGKPYELLSGGFKTIATITPEERRELWDLARTFDRTAPKDTHQEQQINMAGARPGDDFNCRANWHDILEPTGWRMVFERGGVGCWRRPGKDRGVSATTNHNGSDLLYVFSTSTEFEAERGYSKFSAYTILNHGGDFQGAARELNAKGYGINPAQDTPTAQEAQAPVWEPPVPFTVRNPPPFPTDALPGWLKDFVAAEAEATQTPADLAGMLALAVCGAAVAKKVVIFILEGWTEPTNIFTVTALPSGRRKSQVFGDITEPMTEYEEELTSQASPQIEDARNRRKILEAALSNKQNEAAKTKDNRAARDAKINEAADLSRELAECQIPAVPRLVADDCSPERSAGLLQDQGGKLAILAPEGDVFNILAGRYSNGAPNLGIFLRGHAGDTIRVDRVGRPPEYIKSPALTVGLALQPDVLRGLIQKPGFRGRGLLARFLYSIPTSNMGRREIEPPPMPADIRGAYRRNVRILLRLAPSTNDRGEPAAYALRLDTAAGDSFRDFRMRLEPQLAEHGDLGAIQDWGSKLAGAVARIAGILHMAENVESPVPWTIPIGGQVCRRP